MRTWGQALVLCMALAFLGTFVESPERDESTADAMPGIVLIAGLGGWLWYDGQKRLDALRRCSEEVLKANRELGHVNLGQLSGTLQMPETEIRSKIAKAQKKNWVPYGIELK